MLCNQRKVLLVPGSCAVAALLLRGEPPVIRARGRSRARAGGPAERGGGAGGALLWSARHAGGGAGSR